MNEWSCDENRACLTSFSALLTTIEYLASTSCVLPAVAASSSESAAVIVDFAVSFCEEIEDRAKTFLSFAEVVTLSDEFSYLEEESIENLIGNVSGFISTSNIDKIYDVFKEINNQDRVFFDYDEVLVTSDLIDYKNINHPKKLSYWLKFCIDEEEAKKLHKAHLDQPQYKLL